MQHYVHPNKKHALKIKQHLKFLNKSHIGEMYLNLSLLVEYIGWE